MSTENRGANKRGANKRGANKRSAKRLTGPRSAAGKALAAQNAVTHGLCSARPVLSCGSAGEWDRHRAGVVASLRPSGTLEESLAERVAACLWRLRRVVAYETAISVVGMEEAAEGLVANDASALIPVATDRTQLKKVEKKLCVARVDRDLWADTADAFKALTGGADESPLTGSTVEGVFSDVNGAVPDPDNQCEFAGARPAGRSADPRRRGPRPTAQEPKGRERVHPRVTPEGVYDRAAAARAPRPAVRKASPAAGEEARRLTRNPKQPSPIRMRQSWAR